MYKLLYSDALSGNAVFSLFLVAVMVVLLPPRAQEKERERDCRFIRSPKFAVMFPGSFLRIHASANGLLRENVSPGFPLGSSRLRVLSFDRAGTTPN